MNLDAIVIKSAVTYQIVGFIAFDKMPLFVDYLKKNIKELNKKYPNLKYEYLENVESPFQETDYILN